MYALRRTTALHVALFLILALLFGAFVLLGGTAAKAQTTDPGGPPSTTQNIDPVFVPGNPSCTGLGYDIGYKIDGAPFYRTNVGDGTLQVTTTGSGGVFFDWTSNIGVDAVIVKGGPNADAFVYDPVKGEVTLDTALHAPINSNTGQPFGLSHIEFCYDVEPLVSKTANTSFDRTFRWTIDKSVTPATWNLFRGDSGTSKYTVDLTKDDGTDSNWAVSGKITVTNPMASNSMTISGIQDVVSQGATNTNASVSNCTSNGGSIPLPHTLGPKASLECSYNASLSSGTNGTNTATATSSTSGIDPGKGTADVDFSKATINKIDDSITVDDSYAGAGSPWTFSDDGSKTYNRKFSCDGDKGTHDNTATIKETGQSDSAQVKVNCYALDVSKTAETELTRTHRWTIDKSVTPATWNLFTGDSGTSKYTVDVENTGFTDSGWKVSGKITISNPNPNSDASLTSVNDIVSTGIEADVDCPSLTVPKKSGATNGSIECTYSADLPDGSDRTNTATATLQNNDYASDGTATPSGTTPFSGNTPVSFANAKVTPVNDTITVDDSYSGGPQDEKVSLGDSPKTFTYNRKFTCDGDDGTHGNTATIVETGQSDSASVEVNCYALGVRKSADTELTRTYTWDIKKSADKTKLTLPVDGKSPVNYEVTLNATSKDSGWKVSGKITISNPNPNSDASLTSVNDIVSPSIAANVDCPSLTVPKNNGTLECSYRADLPDGSDRTNTAAATLQNNDYDPDGSATPSGTTNFTGTASVSFANAKVINVDEIVEVKDTLQGDLGSVDATKNTLPYKFAYTRDVGPYGSCGDYKVPNTASFTTNDTAAKGSSDWNVDVTVLCKVTVKKTTDGVVNTNRSINFTLTGQGLPDGGITLNTFGDADGVLDFGYKLVPGEKYTICENPVPAGFTSFWKLNGVIVTPYNPGDSKVPQEDLGVRCYDFSASAGQTPAFVIDNSHPGGDPRTIGYWKNWNTCTGGNQAATAAKNGGPAAGVFILNDLLPQTIGDLLLPKTATGCQNAVKILSKQDLSGKSRSSDAAYELASQLLAAKLNLAAGAETCSAVQTAVMDGQALLANGPTDTPKGVNFNGTGSYLPSNTNLTALRTKALNLATTLDQYNNGDVC